MQCESRPWYNQCPNEATVVARWHPDMRRRPVCDGCAELWLEVSGKLDVLMLLDPILPEDEPILLERVG